MKGNHLEVRIESITGTVPMAGSSVMGMGPRVPSNSTKICRNEEGSYGCQPNTAYSAAVLVTRQRLVEIYPATLNVPRGRCLRN